MRLFFYFLIFSLMTASQAVAAGAGYSTFFIPVDDDNLAYVLSDLEPPDSYPTVDTHSVITVTAWADNTVVIYDHWENGYGYDPDNPGTSVIDETFSLDTGDFHKFESASIPVPRVPGSAPYPYDGRDIIYVVGGAATVTRAGWIQEATTLQAVAWEVYPVRPQLIKYILPFGEELNAAGLLDFERVYAFIQATSDDTILQIDFNNDGTFDSFDHDHDGTLDGTQMTLDRGEVYLLDRRSDGSANPFGILQTGTTILASDTVQVQYLIGDQGATWEVRGLSAFPRGFWDDEYYAPVDESTVGGRVTDIYVYNPQGSVLTINWESANGADTFTVPAYSTVSYRDETGVSVPEGGAVYLKGSDVFWGISTIDAEGMIMDWGYSLVPASLLENENYMGWAPGYDFDQVTPPYAEPTTLDERSGLFVSAARDNTTVFIDENNDGTVDQTFTLDRLESAYVVSSDSPSALNDDDLSGARVIATGPIAMAYGQNPDRSFSGDSPALDLGYTILPTTDKWFDLVLDVEKTVSPPILPANTNNEEAVFRLRIFTEKYSVDGITVSDALPSGWEYVAGSTTVTLPDGSMLTGATADDGNSTGDTDLTWSGSDVFGSYSNLAENQTITIVFTARTTVTTFDEGDVSINEVKVVGTRTVQTVTQTFTAKDFAFVTYGDYEISKTSSGSDPLGPGDQYTYTVEVTNPATATQDLTGISIYDAIPSGVSYVAGTSRVQSPTSTVGDRFNTAAYNNQDGTGNWTGNWVENYDDGSPATGDIQISNNELQMNGDGSLLYIYRQSDLSGATSAFWSFDYRTTAGVDAADRIDLYVWNGSWNSVNTITGISGETSGSHRVDISSYISANTLVAFVVFGGNYDGANETFAVDNNYILYDNAIDTAAGTPPNFLSAGDGYGLKPGETLTLTFDVVVDDPLPTGLDEIVNTVSVTTNKFSVPLTAQVSNLVNNPSSGTGEVGDLVWLDTDGDGVKDTGEPGLSNVEVTLKDSFGTPLAVTYTDGSGRYRFTGIAPGTGYYVEVTGGLPSGLVQSAPSGHSDDKTDSFDLSAGQVYLDADLGYTNAAGTGSIGDFVWNDDDGDGIQDSGELGLSGVTVALYFDADNDGVFEPGGDDGPAEATTVTGPDGTYLFNNVDATDGSGTDDYFVYVDATQAALSGFDYTTSPVTRVIDLADGEVNLTNDFGFENTSGSTYTYSDRVWFDADDGGDLDSGETGISGVTVNLLNASRQVVATVTTDANGEFSFSGLTGSTFYYVEISDTAGKLTDYYGTTAAAIAGELQISNLTGDVDNTNNPSFGYNAKGAVGDTVFNDVDGDGVQDAGELGISGIAVKLYNDDDGDGVIDAGVDTVQATLTTDANGNYMFSGLADGNYIVSIESPPGGFSFTGTDSDGSVTGDQLSVSITGGGSDMTVDFGYQSADNRSVAGTLWNDTDGEGDFDETVYMENVTVALYQDTNNDGDLDAGEPLQSTMTTGADGTYSFTGLPSGRYIVVITDENGELNGYETTYEFSGTPFDGQEGVNLTSANVSGIDFGYYNPPVITRAVIGEFNAFNDGGRVVVRWETLSENRTLGFYLERLNETSGQYKTVNKKLLPGFLFNASGGWYQVEDKDAKTGQNYTYRLKEVEITGKLKTYGPWEVFTGTPVSADASGVEYSSVKSISGFERSPRLISEPGKDRLASKMDSKLKNFANKLSRRRNQAKISISENGLYYISAENIAETLSMKPWYVQRLIKRKRIALENRGKSVAVMPAEDNNGLYFYGQALSTRYTDENVYWLSIGKSSIMNAVKGREVKTEEAPAWFMETVHAEEDHWQLASIFDDPSVDFWMWDYVFPGYGKDDMSLIVATPGAMNSLTENIVISIELQGATDVAPGNDHHAMISLNGSVIGETSWNGLNNEIVSFEVDSGLLNDGDNTVTITGIKEDGVAYNIFYLNKIEISYPRAYQATDDQLAAVNDRGNGLLTINGFTDDAIVVLDVTEPNQPEKIDRTRITPDTDNPDLFQVSFNATADQVLFFGATLSSARPAELLADQASMLKTRFNWGDYLVITSGEKMTAAESLADYRSSQGYLSKVVDVEDIYDEFSDGITDAEAIRDFLSYAYQNWRRPPQFVLLAGDGSYDYKDCMGFGAPVIPPLLVGTPDGLFVTDNPYADITGDDGVPEIALGRVPVVSEEELLGYIEKVKAYEAGGDWENRALFVADKKEAGADFPADSDAVADLFSQAFMPDRIYLDQMSIADGRQAFVDSINAGVAYVNFVGHGGIDLIGKQNLFSTNEIAQLSNAAKAPVVTAMTCAAGNFGFLGFDSLNEVMVTDPDGGAVAMWSPAGFADNALSMQLCRAFYRAIFENGALTIGDAVQASQAAFSRDNDGRLYLDLYNLMGDPALRVKK